MVTNDQTIKNSYYSKFNKLFHCGFKSKSACLVFSLVECKLLSSILIVM